MTKMTNPILAPSFPESISEGKLIKWLKKQGDQIKRDEHIADIETDKIVLEVTAPGDGILAIVIPEGTMVSSRAMLGEIALASAAPAVAEMPAVAVANNKVVHNSSPQVNPSAKAMAADLAINIAEVPGSARNGRVTKMDVQNFANGQRSQPAVLPADTNKPTAPNLQQSAPQQPNRHANGRRESFNPVRQRVTQLYSQRQSTVLRVEEEVDMSAVVELCERYGERFSQRNQGSELSILAFLVRVVTQSLQRFPLLNAGIDDTDIVHNEDQHIAVPIVSARGTVAPVIANASQLSLAQIAHQIQRYTEQANQASLSLECLLGSSFTIASSNALLTTPTVNPSQCATLGINRLVNRPIADCSGLVVIRPMMYMVLSYDHRVVDNQYAVDFLITVKDWLQEPQRILLDV